MSFKILAVVITFVVTLTLALAFFLVLAGYKANESAAAIETPGGQPLPSEFAKQTIPANYLAMYVSSTKYCPTIPWTYVAAMGKNESNHGGGGQAVWGVKNWFGAMGPMQFIQLTWAAYGIDGNGDGVKNVYDYADAIPGAYNHLCRNGATDLAGFKRAYFMYACGVKSCTSKNPPRTWSISNPDDVENFYLTIRILELAKQYDGGTPGAGGGSVTLPGDIKFETLPSNLQTVIRTALAQQGKPYWNKDQTRLGPDRFDCSGLMWFSYRAAGIDISYVSYTQKYDGLRITSMNQLQPGDMVVFSHRPGVERPHHIGMYIGGGNMVHAPKTGDVVRIVNIFSSPYYTREFDGGARIVNLNGSINL